VSYFSLEDLAILSYKFYVTVILKLSLYHTENIQSSYFTIHSYRIRPCRVMVTVLHVVPTRYINIPCRQNAETFNIKVDDTYRVFVMEMELISFDLKTEFLNNI